MYKASPIKPLIQFIEKNNENFHVSLSILDRFIEEHLEINDEFQKEFQRIFKKSTKYYQVIIKDTNWIVNIKLSNEKITFLKDFNDYKELIIPIKLTKDSVILILTERESFTSLYMKGAIEIKGGLIEAIKIRNLLNLVFQII